MELLRNSKDKKARKLTKKRVSPAWRVRGGQGRWAAIRAPVVLLGAAMAILALSVERFR